MSDTTTEAPLIHFLAAEKDLPHLKELEQHLSYLRQNGVLCSFSENNLVGGENIDKQVRAHFAQARVLVPILSADLFASKSIMALLDEALALQMAVVPVLLRPCTWRHSTVKDLKVLPADGRPVVENGKSREDAWSEIVDGLLSKIASSDQEKKTSSVESTGTTDRATPLRSALLLVAVTTERRALLEEVRAQLLLLDEIEMEGRYLDAFSLPARKGSSFRVLVGQSTEKGPHAAQSLVQDLVRASQPEVVLLVGMCGGFTEHGATEDGVLVSRQVFNYEPERLRAGQSPWSPTAYRAAARITDLANALAARGTLPDVNILTNKDYGSGEKLVDDLGADLRKRLLDLSGDIAGVEMEGQGMLHALWELQRNNPAVQASVIKGFSDFADGQQRDRKAERQTAATRRAVRLALEILRRY